MMKQETGPSFPITVSVPMTLNKICNGGKITNKTDWRSSGYVEFPAGTTKVRWKNYSSNKAFRVGMPDSDTQTTGITMLNSGNPITVNTNATSSKFSVGTHKYIYISRQYTDTSAIDVIFLNE